MMNEGRLKPCSFALAFLLIITTRLLAAEPSGTTAKIETPFFRFTVNASNGACEILDKQAQVTWRSTANPTHFGWTQLNFHEQSFRVDLAACDVKASGNEIVATFLPFSSRPVTHFTVRARALPDQQTLELSYQEDNELEVESVSLLDQTMAINDTDDGYALLPVREGLLVPANSGLNFTHRFDTSAYEGCHMQMLGLVKKGASAMFTWDDPYVAADLKSTLAPAGAAGPRQILSPSLVLVKSARAFRLHFLGKGDYVSIAKAYREVARTKGLLATWDDKLKTDPERAKLFGAANIKLWSLLDRQMNPESTKEESARVNWTFDEAAQVAEHYKNDLKLDKVLFTLGGWVHRGYDNQHPDVLPAAPECGGDAAFTDCARRVLELGYLLCLHDNYQDIYRDSPSWEESLIQRTDHGKLARGGRWAGGQAYLTCSQKALELAQRPQNLPSVKKLSHANAYFIDTTYAAGLQECFAPAHPLTRGDDLKWKQRLSDYAREVFGVFGSECGREWAVPHSDFFEGLTGVSGHAYHDEKLPENLGATVVPLFDLVYRDCIAMYGKYGYDPNHATGYVLRHISLGRPLNYHSIPAHLYWKTSPLEHVSLQIPSVSIHQTGPRQFEISYDWKVDQKVSADWHAFVHFNDPHGNTKFQNDYQPQPPMSQWTNGNIRQGPFAVTLPEGSAGPFTVRVGLYDPSRGTRAVLGGRANSERSYPVGILTLTGGTLSFEPAPADAPPNGDGGALFVRADDGWADGLHPMDRFIKNTCEVLSPLNALTARWQMSEHQFLNAERKVERTIFGDGSEAVHVIVNSGTNDFLCPSRFGPSVALPPNGFLVESPTYVAFHARNWAGLTYKSSPLFTLQSLDGKPLAQSHRVRVFHGFGDNLVQVGKSTRRVNKEELLDATL